MHLQNMHSVLITSNACLLPLNPRKSSSLTGKSLAEYFVAATPKAQSASGSPYDAQFRTVSAHLASPLLPLHPRSVDIFFLDWEKPRRILAKGGGREEPGPVSAWRGLLVANEWNELQTARLTSPSFTLIFMVRAPVFASQECADYCP
jgi:hypothetical protein